MTNIEGRQPVLEWLRSDRPINKIFIAQGVEQGPLQRILKIAKDKKIPVQEVDKQYLNSISETRSHQGVIAQVSSVDYWELDQLLASIKQTEQPPLLLLLDGIQDPHNLGSLIRTAESAGVQGVIIPARRAVGVTATVAKTSAGAVSYMPICRVTNLVATMKRLKQENIWIAGADMEGTLCYDQDLTGPLALVIGGEGEGLSRLVKDNCDFLVKMPMKGQLNSLNASVAGALVIYEVLRQRRVK